MCWDVCTATEPVARKEYHCEASDWIDNSGLQEGDFTPEDWAIIEQARAEDFKIKPGTAYHHVRGMFEGEWSTYRARVDMDRICQKYQLYEYC